MIYELLKDRIINGGSGSEAIIESLSISANGTYTAPADIDGYSPITVNVPQKEPNIQNLSITTNGTYTAPSGTDGYSPVVVDVQPDLENITITANGTYTHTGKDGYDQVVVNVPQEGLDVSNITISDTPTGLFSNNKWDALMPYFRNITVNPSSSWNLNNLYANSNYTDLSHITFKMNCDMSYFQGIQRTFNGCSMLTALPNFDWSSTFAGAPYSSFQVNNIFSGCNNLRTIPDTFFSDIPLSDRNTPNIRGEGMFDYCNSLRKLPDLSWFNDRNTSFSGNGDIYQRIFQHCIALDEIVDLPVLKVSSSTRNAFENGFYNCARIKEMTFKTGTDSTPRADSGWKSQTIDLSENVGWAYNNNYILGQNSGITADKEVTDDASYQALKNDPDWFTCNVAYSRYNHDSAVNTINSLPDWSSSGTNTIKFLGASGSATDGGAISTLTAEEIAVATAKGWTVTLV